MSINIAFPDTVSDFMSDPSHVKFICGPVGSGKTIGCITLLVYLSALQAKGPDGIRYTRWALCRYTLQALKNTVLKDFMQWFGEIAFYKVSESTIFIRQGDINCEILLLPLETLEDQKRLLSTQLTGCMINEFADIDPSLIPAVLGRCGRYPSGMRGKPSWRGVFGDTNPGLETSVWFKRLKLELPSGWAYYEQPAPIDDDGKFTEDGENVKNLPDTYYQDLLASAYPSWAERYIFGRWGQDLTGLAVYKDTFVMDTHVSRDENGQYQTIKPRPGRMLMGGLDTGRNPALILGQTDEIGRLLVLKELYGVGIGMEKFLQEQVLPELRDIRWFGLPLAIILDPAAVARSEWSEDNILKLIKATGFSAYLASTNAIDPRLRSVEKWLRQTRGGGPAFLMDGINCPRLLKGFQGEYKFEAKLRSEEIEEKPTKKHPVSDLHDGLQYLCLGTSQNVQARMLNSQKMGQHKEVVPAVEGWC